MKIDATTLYYLFSTVAQTHGAILGLVGMLVLHRFEQLEKYSPSTKIDRVEGGTKDRWIFFLFLNLIVIAFSLFLLPFSKAMEEITWLKALCIVVLGILVFITMSVTAICGLEFTETKWVDFWKRTKVNIVEHCQRYWHWFKSVFRRR